MASFILITQTSAVTYKLTTITFLNSDWHKSWGGEVDVIAMIIKL